MDSKNKKDKAVINAMAIAVEAVMDKFMSDPNKKVDSFKPL